MKNVLIIGSLNMDYTVYVNDFPLQGETIYGKSRYIQPGGKGENQAVAVAKSKKVNCHMIGAVGNDIDGKQIQEVLNSYGVISHLLIKENTETGNATITVSDKGENEIVIISGANGELLPKDIDIELIKNADYIVLQNEIPLITNEFIFEKAYELNKIIVYNPAPYRELDEKYFKYITYFIPNEVELMKYSNTSDINKGIEYLINKGIKNVLVTLGTKGSLFVNKNERFEVPCYKVEAIDTVAAGDTYVGYFVSSLAASYSILESMDIASKASSITVSRKGSVISIPNGEEVYE